MVVIKIWTSLSNRTPIIHTVDYKVDRSKTQAVFVGKDRARLLAEDNEKKVFTPALTSWRSYLCKYFQFTFRDTLKREVTLSQSL